MTGHLVGHIVRRGVQHLTAKQQHIQQLEQDAELYENAGPEMEVKPLEMLPVILTGLAALFVIWSVCIGNTIQRLWHSTNSMNRLTIPSVK